MDGARPGSSVSADHQTPWKFAHQIARSCSASSLRSAAWRAPDGWFGAPPVTDRGFPPRSPARPPTGSRQIPDCRRKNRLRVSAGVPTRSPTCGKARSCRCWWQHPVSQHQHVRRVARRDRARHDRGGASARGRIPIRGIIWNRILYHA